MIERPKVGQVWQYKGLQREVVCVEDKKPYLFTDDTIVTWRRPGCEKETTVWLPYWRDWRNKAHLVW